MSRRINANCSQSVFIRHACNARTAITSVKVLLRLRCYTEQHYGPRIVCTLAKRCLPTVLISTSPLIHETTQQPGPIAALSYFFSKPRNGYTLFAKRSISNRMHRSGGFKLNSSYRRSTSVAQRRATCTETRALSLNAGRFLFLQTVCSQSSLSLPVQLFVVSC